MSWCSGLGDMDSQFSLNAQLYGWRELARRAGIRAGDPAGTGFESLPITLTYGEPTAALPIVSTVIVVPCSAAAWTVLQERAQRTLDWQPAIDIFPIKHLPLDIEKIPILFWGAGYEDGHKPFVEQRDDGTVIFYVDIIATTLFMLSRWEESILPQRDKYGRFPAEASVAYRQGFLDRPIVDEYALILRAWISVLLPQWQPTARTFSVKLSHDIDSIRQFPTWQKGVRQTLGQVQRQQLHAAWQSAKAMATDIAMSSKTPQMQGIHELATLSEHYGLESAFYLMAATPSNFDNGYDPTATVVRKCVDQLRHRGHEIGFHPGFYTADDCERFMMEKERMDLLLGKVPYGGRQHFLRFRVPQTWRCWEKARMRYDSTVGFAEVIGFRAGTCHPYNPFDMQEDREMTILEKPLIVMDTTLNHYLQLTHEQSLAEVARFARICRAVEGDFVLLWHNYSTGFLDWHPCSQIYRRLVAMLAEL